MEQVTLGGEENDSKVCTRSNGMAERKRGTKHESNAVDGQSRLQSCNVGSGIRAYEAKTL